MFSAYKSVWMLKVVKCFRILWDKRCYINVKYSVIIYYYCTHGKHSWDYLFVAVMMALCDMSYHSAQIFISHESDEPSSFSFPFAHYFTGSVSIPFLFYPYLVRFLEIAFSEVLSFSEKFICFLFSFSSV